MENHQWTIWLIWGYGCSCHIQPYVSTAVVLCGIQVPSYSDLTMITMDRTGEKNLILIMASSSGSWLNRPAANRYLQTQEITNAHAWSVFCRISRDSYIRAKHCTVVVWWNWPGVTEEAAVNGAHARQRHEDHEEPHYARIRLFCKRLHVKSYRVFMTWRYTCIVVMTTNPVLATKKNDILPEPRQMTTNPVLATKKRHITRATASDVRSSSVVSTEKYAALVST